MRLRVSANPDATYNQPSILLWAYVPHLSTRACSADISCSTAEVSTGIICVCLPTLAALARPNRRGPTASIMNGQSNSRGQSYYRRKQLGDSDDQTLVSGNYLELGERNHDNPGVQVPQRTVVTGIEGGTHSSEFHQDHGIAMAGYEADLVQGPAILKTVRIEQSSM